MSELQVTARYRYLPAKIIFLTMLALTPIWAFGAPVLFGFVIGKILHETGSVSVLSALTICPTMLLVICMGLAITTITEDNRLGLSKNGISFPLFLTPKLGFRRYRSWTELLSADLSLPLDAKGCECPILSLTFDDGSALSFSLNKFKNLESDQVLLGIEVWGTNCRRSPELVEYQHRSQNEAHGIKGYTQMWEEELDRRFQSTTFIPLEPGEVIHQGRLKIIRQLAFGGLSAIYLAQENDAGHVVLKEAVVPQNAAPDVKAEAEKLLEREAQVLARLNHPNIARVLDHFVDRGRDYLKLEYVNGVDLRQYVKENGPLDQSMAISWGLKMLEILQYLHEQNPPIIHRDLTPENLVFAKNDITLIDFGAANQFVGTATGTVVGKQAYMPPEQLRGKTVIESDIYAFGGTLFYLLTGIDPVPLSTSRPKKHALDIHTGLDDVVAKCSEFEPESRYHSAKEIAIALQEVLRLLQSAEKTSEAQPA